MNDIFNIKTVEGLETFLDLISKTIDYEDSSNSKSYVAKILGFKSYNEAYRELKELEKSKHISEPIKLIIEDMYDIDENFCGRKIDDFIIDTFKPDNKSKSNNDLNNVLDTGLWHQDDATDTLFIKLSDHVHDKLFVFGTSEGMKAYNFNRMNIELGLYSFIIFNLNKFKDGDVVSKSDVVLLKTSNEFTELKGFFSSLL